MSDGFHGCHGFCSKHAWSVSYSSSAVQMKIVQSGMGIDCGKSSIWQVSAVGVWTGMRFPTAGLPLVWKYTYSDCKLALSWLLLASQGQVLKYGWLAFLCDQLFIKEHKKTGGEEGKGGTKGKNPTQTSLGEWKAISGQADDFASQVASCLSEVFLGKVQAFYFRLLNKTLLFLNSFCSGV